MSNIPPDWQGYIQQEETSGAGQLSEYVVQKLGGDLNYLKKELDVMNTSIANLIASYPVVVEEFWTPVNASSHSTSGAIFMAVAGPMLGSQIFNTYNALILPGVRSWFTYTAETKWASISGSTILFDAGVLGLSWKGWLVRQL